MKRLFRLLSSNPKPVRYIILLHGLIIANAAFAQIGGRVKITLQSFTCINKSWDGVVEFDGHGNEVSVNCSWRIFSRANPNAVRRGGDGTVIFGSAVNGMTRAGSQTPDLGGIKNGDVINVSKPLMDDHLNPDEVLVMAPTVWEWDGPEKATLTAFNNQLEADLDWVTRQTYPFANVRPSSWDPYGDRVFKIFDKYPYGQALKYHSVFKSFLCPGNTQGNRVIGIRSGTFNKECLVVYPPTLLVLDPDVLYTMYYNGTPSKTHAEKESKGGYSDGVTVTFTENTYAIETSNGSYSVRLKIEYFPDVSNNSTATINNDLPRKTATQRGSLGNLIAPVVAKWSGIRATASNMNRQPVAFELTMANEIIMTDQSGAVAAKGTYSFNSATNDVNGNFKQVSSGETFAFYGSYDPNTQKLYCRVGLANTATSGHEIWTMNKL